ncbi:tyrosine-type recombinase/integrase [Cystobacter fuscus]
MAHLDRYLEYVRAERGLGARTVDEYGQELARYLAWLSEEHQAGAVEATQAHVEDFLRVAQERGAGAPGRARTSRCCGSSTAFCRWRDWPPWTRPSSSSGRDKPAGYRRCWVARTWRRCWWAWTPPSLEPARRCRARVLLRHGGARLELCALRLKDVELGAGFVRVRGKGQKERMVPVGQAALQRLERYLREARPAILKGRKSNVLFVTTWGGASRAARWRSS